MDAIIHGFQGIFTVMLIIGAGFILARRQWFDESSTKLIARLVTQLCLPTYMVVNLTTSFSQQEMFATISGVTVPLLSVAISYLIAQLVARLIRVPRSRRGVFCSIFFTANSIFIGLPLTIALLGEKSVPAIMLYYIANTLSFWVVAVHDIAQDAGLDAPFLSRATLRAVMSPPLWGFIIGIVLVALDIRLPVPLESAFRYLGSMTTPLAMLFIGIAISKVRFEELHFDREIGAAMFGRFVVSPCCVLVLLPFFALPTLTAEVFVVQSAMPAMTNTSIVAAAYGADYKYAAMMTVISVFVAIVTTPFYMWVLRG